jgi:hypothetical protein
MKTKFNALAGPGESKLCKLDKLVTVTCLSRDGAAGSLPARRMGTLRGDLLILTLTYK